MKSILNIVLILDLLFLFSCQHPADPSPYAAILGQSPYASITDSLKDNRDNDRLYFRRGVLLRNNDLKEPALADFKTAWSLKNREEYAANISAILLNQRADSAIIFIRNALQKLPGSIFLKLDLARAYKSQDQTDEALSVCHDIIEKAPGQIDALMLESELLDQKKDSSGALSSLEKAYALAPFDLELNYSLAFKYAQNRNIKAISLCDSLLKMDSSHTHAEPYYFKGVYYANVNEKEKAIQFFDLAIQHDYNFLDAYLDKGRIFFEQRRINDALKVFNLAATVSPAYADAYYWIGKCQQALGNKEEARENYQRAYGFDKSLSEAKDSADRIR